MNDFQPINHAEIIKREWRKVLVVNMVVLLLGLVITLVRPFEYRAESSVYVVQKSSFSIDAYSASKSEERIASKLGQILYSSSFFEEILTSGYDIEKDYFPEDEYKKRKKWEKTVETKVPGGLSKLEIFVYHPDPRQAMQISQAITYTLTHNKEEFIGISDVDLKVLDSPLVSKYPVRPNVLLNLILALVIGGALGIAFVLLTYDPREDELLGLSDENRPHLIEKDKIKQKPKKVKKSKNKEIKDLDEIKDLAMAEDNPKKPVEEIRDLPDESKIEIPDIGQKIKDQQGVDQKNPMEKSQEKRSKELQIPDIPQAGQKKKKNKDLPEFAQEDEIINMPRK